MGVAVHNDRAGTHCSEAKVDVMASLAPTLVQDHPPAKQARQVGEGTGYASVRVAGLLSCGGVHCRGQAVLLAFQPLTWMDSRQQGWRRALCLGHHPEGRGLPCQALTYGSARRWPSGSAFLASPASWLRLS